VKELTLFNGLLAGWFVLGAAVFVALFFVAAPYGRYIRRGWGRTIGNTAGWVLMEAPAPVVLAVCFITGGAAITAPSLVFLGLWEAHYLHRAFIYPFSRRDSAVRMPLAVVSLGFLFNILNGYLNGRYLFHFSGGYAAGWLVDPRFIIGAALFVAGFVINRRADLALRELRRPGERTYRMTSRGFYRWISCPNYLGEIIIWAGWAMTTWSLPGLAFAFWTTANLLPRARAHHAWYRRQFPDYPPERKAILPGIW
jgi:3-oxo-5-alpha-steroid 4-dehydrogenase 1